MKKTADTMRKEVFILMLIEGPILPDGRVNLKYIYKFSNY